MESVLPSEGFSADEISQVDTYGPHSQDRFLSCVMLGKSVLS